MPISMPKNNKGLCAEYVSLQLSCEKKNLDQVKTSIIVYADIPEIIE
jgi:hypothetical protein